VTEPETLASELKQLRERLGLTIHAMAELLYTSQQTYRNWEAGSKPRREAAIRIGRFITSATDQLDELKAGGWDLKGLVPLSIASSLLGIPHETLFHAYRDDRYQAFDLGMLGIWVIQDQLDDILDAVLA
jgi:Predicted transcriptional regulator